MYSAIAKIGSAARRLQFFGGVGQSEYSRILVQLHDIADHLNALERRLGGEKPAPVNFTNLLRNALGAGQGASDVLVQVPQDIMIEGPAFDVRDMVCSLAEYAVIVGRDRIQMRAQIKYVGDRGRALCETELAIQSAHVPESLQRKLRHTVHARRGELSVVSEPERCRITFTLPVERRLGTILG